MNLYLDAVGGVAGDMLISSLLATKIVDTQEFVKAMEHLSISGEFKIEIKPMLKGSIGGLHTKVVHSEDHHHRHLSDVVDIINSSELPQKVKDDAIGVFEILAKSEAKVHQSTLESVHFHEVGAVDSIVDIVGVCLLLYMMKIETIYSSSLPISEGFVNTAHGKMPLPAPATLELLQGMNTHFVDCKKETITPTGGAILSYFEAKFSRPPMEVLATGVGCGSMDFEYPNILRAIIFNKKENINQQEDDIIREKLFVLSANIDDMTPEELSYASDVLRQYALDVDIQAITMKKGRLAFRLNVLCCEETKKMLIRAMFKETSTIGIKEESVIRHSLKREFDKMETSKGEFTVKRAYMDGKVLKEKVEFRERAEFAEQETLSILDVRL